jgi:hypothetical protein
MSKPHTLYSQKVTLDPISHTYRCNDGHEYMGFSRFYEFLAPKFDAEFIAGQMAKSEGRTKGDVLSGWRGATDHGTRIDAALELYAQTGQILAENEDIEPLIKHVLSKYSKYHSCYEQLVVFDEKTRTAGSIDKLALLSNRKDGKFHLSDFKCFDNGMSYDVKGSPWLNYPLNYMPNTKYTKISLQTSYYALHFEKLTGRRCEKIFIDMIQPIKEKDKIAGYKNYVIPVPYLKHQVEAAIEHFQSNIINTLTPIELEEF